MLIVKAEFHVDADDSQQAVDHDGPIWEIAYKYVEDGVVVD